MNVRNLILGTAAYGLLMGGGCLQTGCSVASRAKWQSSAEHTGQALTHTGGAIVDGTEAVVLDVGWLFGQVLGPLKIIPLAEQPQDLNARLVREAEVRRQRARIIHPSGRTD